MATIPASMTPPIREETLSGVFVHHNANVTPKSESGMISRITVGAVKARNWNIITL